MVLFVCRLFGVPQLTSKAVESERDCISHNSERAVSEPSVSPQAQAPVPRPGLPHFTSTVNTPRREFVAPDIYASQAGGFEGERFGSHQSPGSVLGLYCVLTKQPSWPKDLQALEGVESLGSRDRAP